MIAEKHTLTVYLFTLTVTCWTTSLQSIGSLGPQSVTTLARSVAIQHLFNKIYHAIFLNFTLLFLIFYPFYVFFYWLFSTAQLNCYKCLNNRALVTDKHVHYADRVIVNKLSLLFVIQFIFKLNNVLRYGGGCCCCFHPLLWKRDDDYDDDDDDSV